MQGIGYQTTKNYLTTAYDKLGAVGMVDAFVILGWLKVPE
jgi:DNA-binding CsgD family transcriptional regulator